MRLDGFPRQPHSEESAETAINDSLIPLLWIVPRDAFEKARDRWMDSAPSLETLSGVLGSLTLAAAKSSLISSGSIDRRLDFINLKNEHPFLAEFYF